ncbi:carboxymuconolactone decarboxylase family protein [Streptomyces purpureus]|uniref:Alkyl hydroperoxide reductase AhpD n=1 Tax=Streptomyces purpureus TaxID=1951 RepID=A0A918LVM9_9ACTN|nr:carboxymuconolactone decarboxylase family protein [Streptomyces purpureus]GGT58931.1 alkyl hydroperoxide reductase AhpD [Streptomyces purpureus]
MPARTDRLSADVYHALAAASAAAKEGLGDPVLVELVMLRASQINRCAFCVDMHLTLARKNGVSERSLDLLQVWEETDGVFTAPERAALALTEAVTVLTDGFVPDEVYERAAAHFDAPALAHLLALITVINSWNRIMVSRRTPPGELVWQ